MDDQKGIVIRSIQWLRGLAALAVLLRHTSSTAPNYGYVVSWFTGRDIGAWGVSLFFVISGFIMVRTTFGIPPGIGSAKRFMLRRILRIAPIYWIITAAIVALAYFYPIGTNYKLSFDNALSSFLFVPAVDAAGLVHPPLRVGWTLNFEMYFYAIFGLTLFVRPTYRLPLLMVWSLIAVSAGLVYEFQLPVMRMLTNHLVALFALGAVGGYISRDLRLSPALAWAGVAVSWIAVLSFGALGYDGEGRVSTFVYGVSFLCLICCVTSIERAKNYSFRLKPMLLVGDWSYALYLIHVPALAISGKIMLKVGLIGVLPGYVILTLNVLICIFAGCLMFYFAEKPLQHMARWLLARNSGQAPATQGSTQQPVRS